MKDVLAWILSVILLLCIQAQTSESTATVKITFLDFINPYQRKFNGDCCDPYCGSACDLLYRICFNDTSPMSECATTTYDVYVTPGSMFSYHLESWPGQLPLKILVYDIDAGRNEFVDYFIITLNVSSIPYSSQLGNQSTVSSTTAVNNNSPASSATTLPGSATTTSVQSNSTVSFPGIREVFRTQILLDVVVVCDQHYYTAKCNVFCANSDTCKGHYTCDNVTGQKVCFPQYTGSECNMFSGNDTCPSTPVPSAGNEGVGPCQMFDVVLILDSSGSINNLDPNNWQYMKTFVKSLSDRVTIGRSDFQFGVVTFSDFAQLNIKLNDALTSMAFQNRVDALPYLGQKTNLRDGLRLARSDGFLARNGGRNAAYRSVILVYDGETPTPEFGTLVNEAPRLRGSGVDVTVVSLKYFFANGLATRDLVRNIASDPLVDHLFDDLDSWSRLSNTLAPTILANLYDSCQRKLSSGVIATTVVPSATSGLSGLSVPTSSSANSVAGSPVSPTSAATTLPPTSSSGTTLPTTSSTSFLSFSSTTAILSTIMTRGNATTDQYCSYRGSCSSQNGTNSCCCQPGYVGNQCEYEDDPCAENPCNGGTCTNVNRLNFTCLCLPGFSGDRCQTVGSRVSACNASTTTSQPQSQCSTIPPAPCTEFYYGTNCDRFCRPEDTCSIHVSCDSNGQKVCLPGWKNVSANCTENNGYNSTGCSSQCRNGGFCFGTICCCQSGFTGLACEISISNGTTSAGSSTTGLTASTPSVFTGISSSVTGLSAASSLSTQSSSQSGATSQTTLPTSPTFFTGLTNSSVSPTIFTGLTNSSMSPTIFTGLTNSSISPTIFTGLTNSSVSPPVFTGLTNSSISSTVFTGLTNSSISPTIFTGLTNASVSPTIFTGLTNSSISPTIFTGLTNSSISPTIFTGLTNSSISPTVFTGLTNSSISPTVFTGLTNSSTSPTIFPGLTNSSISSAVFTGLTNSTSSLSPSTSSFASAVIGSTSMPPVSTSNSSSATTSASISSTLESNGTTLSQQEQLVAYLRNYIRNSFPDLSPLDQQQLLNQLLSLLPAPAALAVDDPLDRTPVYVSPPWHGSGRLSNYTIQLEILEAYLGKDLDNNWQLMLKYYYILTDIKSGNVTKVSPDEYQQLMYEDDDSKMDMSLLDPANRFQIVVYGSQLDIPVRNKFSVAFRNAFGLLNSAWTKKPSARVLIGNVEDLIALTGEDLTLFSFWLVSNSSDTESPNSIISPSNAAIVTELSNLGVKASVCQSAAWFKASDSYGIFVKGVVPYNDLVKFTDLLSRYLKNDSRIPSNFTAKVVRQEKYYLSNGTSVNRLVYFVYDATTFGIIPNSLGFVPPSSEQLMTLNSLGDIPYELVKTNDGKNALGLKLAFFISVFDHPVISTFSAIQDIVQERIRKIPNYAAANVKVVGSEEYFYFTTSKRLDFNRILWFLFNNGSLVDGRRFRSIFPSMTEWMSLLQRVKLPNGQQYRFMTYDTSDDSVVRRSECFYQPISGSILDFESIESAMTSLLQRQTTELITTRSVATVVYAEEYVNSSGSSVTVLFYIVETPNRDMYFTVLDASTISDDIIPTSSLASEIAPVGLSGPSYILLNKSEVKQMTRYASLCHLFLKQRPLATDRNKFSQKLTSYFKSLSLIATVKILTVEEFIEKDGHSFWSIGYSLVLDGETLWPENLDQTEVTLNVDVVAVTGLNYTSILPATEDFHRIRDLFSFYVTDDVSTADRKQLEKLLAQAFRQEFPEFSESVIQINIVSVMEYVNTNGTSVWKIFYQLNVDQYPLSAFQHDTLGIYILSVIISQFPTSHLWTGDSNLLLELPSLSSVVMNRVLFPNDLILLEKLVQTGVVQTLLKLGNLSDQFVLSVKRQRECITLSGTLEWCIDFSASLAGESLYPGLLPMDRINASALNILLHSSSQTAKYEVIDVKPSFVYDYKKSFHVLLNRKLNSSELALLETFLAQLYAYIVPNSDFKVKVAGVEELIIMVDRSLLDSPSAWQVLYYVMLDGVSLNGATENPLNSTILNTFIKQSNHLTWKDLFIVDLNFTTVRESESLKLLSLGTVSSANFPSLNKDLGLRLQQILGTENVSATALKRLAMISQNGIIYTEIHFSIMQNGKVLDGNLIQMDKISHLNGIMLIMNPDTSIPGGIFEQSSLFSIGFWQPVIGSSSFMLLETALASAYEGVFCSRASVKTVIQFEAIQKSGVSVYSILYLLSCNGTKQDSRTYSQSLDIDSLWASLSASGFSSQLYDGVLKESVPVSQLLKIPFTTYVTPLDYLIIEETLHQSATSFGLSAIEFQILDQRDYLDDAGKFWYTLLCSSTLNGQTLNAADLFPVLNRSIAIIEQMISPSGSKYIVSASNPALLRPVTSSAIVYFANYIQRANESELLLAIIKAIPGLEAKFNNVTAEIILIDRVLNYRSFPFFRYFIFLSTPLMPDEFIDLSLEPPINASVLSFAVPTMIQNVSLVTPVRELRKSFLLTVKGFVAFSDVSVFLKRLQVLWGHLIQGSQVQEAVVEEYIGDNGETVTGLAYFVIQNGSIVDPTSVQIPSADVLESYVFSAMPRYKSYFGNVFLYQEAFCYAVEGDLSVAKDNWKSKSAPTESVRLLQFQPAFGLYGTSVTRICYTASTNGRQLVPDRDPSPISDKFLEDDTIVRKDALYSFMFYGSPTNEILVKLAQCLEVLWEKSLGNIATTITVYGFEMKLTASPGITLVTEVSYGVTCNGSMLRPIDRSPPSVDECLRNLSLQTFAGESVKLRSLFLNDPRPLSNFSERFMNAIKSAWNNIPGNIVKVKIPNTSQEMFSSDQFEPIMKVDYAVTQLNDSDDQDFLEPSFKRLSDQLLMQGLKWCSCDAWHNFRFFTKESANSVIGKRNAIVTALHKAWSDANPDIEQSLIDIRVNQTGARKKRTADISSYEDSDGNQLTVFNYHVSIQNQDPNSLFIRYPSEPSILENLWNIAALQACTSCTLQKCGKIYVAGKLSADDKFLIVQALTSAFVDANQPYIQDTDIAVNIKMIVDVKDSSGATVSEVSYCVYWTANTTLSDLMIPTYDQISVALKRYGKEPVSSSVVVSGTEKLSYNVKIAIIVACCVGGFLLLLLIGLVVGRIFYQRRKLLVNPPDQDRQKLSLSDSDSYIGHGLYNPSPYNSLNSGPVRSKLKFHDSPSSDIST